MADPTQTSPSLGAIDPQILSTTGAGDPAPTSTTSPSNAESTAPAGTDSSGVTPSSNGNQVAVFSTIDYSTTQSVTTVQQVTNNTVNNVTNNYYTSTTTAAAGSTAPGASAAAAAAYPLLRRQGYRLSFHSRQYGAGGRVDRIIGFNIEAGDQLTLAKSAFPGIDTLSFRSVSSRRSLRKASRSSVDIVYLQSSGELYFNANGTSKGFGSDGGLFAVLEQKPALGSAQLQLA